MDIHGSMRRLAVALLLACMIETAVAPRPFLDHPTCPRDPELTRGRSCSKKCMRDEDCKGKRLCLCDRPCGMVCVKPRKRCPAPDPTPHAEIERLENDSRPRRAANYTFGAVVVYRCTGGYVLTGAGERVCQGDGTWSGGVPTCQPNGISCPVPDPIEHGEFERLDTDDKSAGNYTHGTVIVYRCDGGHTLTGHKERACKPDGHWSGEVPICEPNARCGFAPWVPHAAHTSPAGASHYPLGALLRFRCMEGYALHGNSEARCVGEGRWWGPKMTCEPVRCGHPGNIPHSRRHGNVFVYPFQVTYSCDDGYRLVTHSLRGAAGVRKCLANGQWSGTPVVCIPIRCPALPEPVNGTLIGSDRTYGATAHFYCREGYKLLGSSRRQCRMDGTWSGKSVVCEMVDCGYPGPLQNGYLDSQGTTYKSVITFKCNSRATFEGHGIETMCQQNGSWSIGLPKCWDKCKVPQISEDSAIAGAYMDHGVALKFACPEGRERNTTEDPVCYNGTWTIPPICVPETCKERPGEIRDGHVRFYTLKHGDRARYKCNTGFLLRGPEYVTCQFGKWVGKIPVCEHVYCEHPGAIKNGVIMLVGVIGKYEYRSYVRDIWHNQEIEFHCDKEYKRVGPAAATCVGGKWSPSTLPRCIRKRHPRILYLFRGKRDLTSQKGNGLTSDEDSVRVTSEHQRQQELTSLVDQHLKVVTEHDWDEDKGLCEVPFILQGHVTTFPEGYFVPHKSVMTVKCNDGYSLVKGQGQSTCDDGMWSWVPGCLPNDVGHT